MLRPGDAGDPAGLPAPDAHRGRRQGRQEPLHREARRRRRPRHPQGHRRLRGGQEQGPRASSPALSVGTRPATSRAMKRIHDGAHRRRSPRPASTGTQGGIWAVAKRKAERAGATSSTRSATGITSSGSAATTSSSSTCTTWTWPTGPDGRRPGHRSAVGMGGRQVRTASPSDGQSYDHFAVDYEYPNDVHVHEHRAARSTAARTTSRRRSSAPRARCTSQGGYRFTGPNKGRVRAQGSTPTSRSTATCSRASVAGKPINELKHGGREHPHRHHGPDVGLHRQGRDLGPGAELEARHLPQAPRMNRRHGGAPGAAIPGRPS